MPHKRRHGGGYVGRLSAKDAKVVREAEEVTTAATDRLAGAEILARNNPG
jgi:hypothetical protein